MSENDYSHDIGDQAARFDVQEKLGWGAYGIVYKAYDKNLQKVSDAPQIANGQI